MKKDNKSAEQPLSKSPKRPAYTPPQNQRLFGTPSVESSVTFGPSLRRLLGYLRPESATLWIVISLAVLGVILNVIVPKLLGHATDIIFTGVIGEQLPAGVTKAQAVESLQMSGQERFAELVRGLNVVPGYGIDFDDLFQVLLIAIGLYLLSSFCLWLQGYLLNRSVQRMVYGLRSQLEAKLHRLPLSYFDNIARGELLSRVTNDIDNVSQSLQQALSQVLTAVLTLVGVAAMMVAVSPLLAIIALISVPASMLVTSAIARHSKTRFIEQWRSTGQLNAQIEEAFTGHVLVKLYSRRKDVEASFSEKNHELFSAGFGAQFLSGLIMPAVALIGNINYVLIAVVGGLRVASGSMKLGDVQAFIQYSRMFMQPLTQLASMANLMQSGVASAERVFELLDEADEARDLPAALKPIRGRVEFKQVSFSYSPGKPLITDLSFEVEPGQTVAIVGPTGAGKTTLVNLLMRFYDVDAGKITIDQVDIRTVSRRELRSKMGMVLQDTWLFHGTIRENIAYGYPGASDDEIQAAAEASFVDRFVHSLPHGYDTVIDEDSENISAGEKQLLTIARAFIANPSLLILDEATSSVDTRTELLLQRAMASLRSQRTSFVIAHRLSTIRDADLILVMENGAIVEMGTHAELRAARGRYYALYQSQYAGAMEG